MTATSVSPSVDALLEAAKSLSREERGEFFDRFTEVLGEDERGVGAPISSEWMEEVKQCIADDEAGLAEWSDAAEVVARLRDSLNHPA